MLGAVAVLAVALVSPLDAAADRSVAWHMAQHLLLISIAAPMLVVARPVEVVPWLLPAQWRNRVRRRRHTLRRPRTSPERAQFVAAGALAATVLVFHLPRVYDAATSSPLLHACEHASFVAASAVFWWTLVGSRRRSSHPSGVLALFGFGLVMTGLGALLVLADEAFYELPRATSTSAVDRLVDQQLAGVLMWAYGGLLTAVSALTLFTAWLRHAERRHPGIGVGHRLTVLPLVPLGAAAVMFAVVFLRPSATPVGASGTGSSPPVAMIYERDCAECHGSDAAGTAKGPSLVEVGAGYVDYVVSTGRMPIQRPDDPVERGPAGYDRPTTIALANYVASLGGTTDAPAIPDASEFTDGGQVPRGGELYRLNCAACHQSVGAGGALVERAAPPLGSATATQTAEAIRAGPFEMPAFGRADLSDQDVVDVTAYVTQVIQQPEDRGGWAIWHLGPVPEGAVAIVIGLGTLVLIMRWIEPRSESDRSDRSA